MTIQTTSNLSNAVRTRYIEDYIRGAKQVRVYDQFAFPVGKDMSRLSHGSSVTVNFLSGMTPSTTAISETVDVVPQYLRDATATVTPTSRADALQWAEKLELQSYTNYGKERFHVLGQNHMESVDILARDVCLQGANSYSPSARASLNAGTSTDLLTSDSFRIMDVTLERNRVPAYVDSNGRSMWFAMMPPEAYHDIIDSTDMTAIGQYQDKRILLDWEVAEIGRFIIGKSAFAKVFGGAGADNATAIATTLDGASNALDTDIDVASGTSIAAGMWLTIGTEETANTHYATNERVKVTAVSTANLTIIGSGENGGLRYDHASGVAVRNADSVYPAVFGGPSSVAKVYNLETGEYGTVVGPKKQGIVDQWGSIGWKFYGGYGIINEAWLVRGEFSSSLDA